MTSVVVDPSDYVKPSPAKEQQQQDSSVDVDVGSEYLSSVTSSSSSGHQRSHSYKSRSSSASGHTAPTSSSVLQIPHCSNSKAEHRLESPTLYEEDQDETMIPLEDPSYH